MDTHPGAHSFADLGGKVTSVRGDVTQFDEVMTAMTTLASNNEGIAMEGAAQPNSDLSSTPRAVTSTVRIAFATNTSVSPSNGAKMGTWKS